MRRLAGHLPAPERRLPRRLPRRLLAALALTALAVACARTLPPPRTPEPSPEEEGREAASVPGEPVRPEPPLPAEPEPPPVLPEGPVLLRVGLATDLEEARVPCCREKLHIEADGRRWVVRSPLAVTPSAGSSRQGWFRVQVAALKDEGQAHDLARRLAEHTGREADAHFDAGIDLYRVRSGRFASREQAETARRELTALGMAGVWIVSEGGGVTEPAFRLVRAGAPGAAGPSVELPGRWLAVAAAEGQGTGGDGGVPSLAPGAAGGRYRGRLLLYLNDRGRLNLINEISLDDYLRSVVPSEMGPELYGQLEALKAQAVAARTYTLKNLGEFTGEGYDICATPRCQVYRGVAAEHALSDRAVAETTRQVLLYRGELVDARYSSACGGHTEDVEVVFPLEEAPYLRGVPCPEAGGDRLQGTLPAGSRFPDAFTRRLLPPPAGDGADPRASLEARLGALAARAGLPRPADRLASLERREVRRFVASLFDLALDPRFFLPPEDLARLLARPPEAWSAEEARQAADLAAGGLYTGDPGRPLTAGEVEEALLALAELLRVVERLDTHHLAADDGILTVRTGAGTARHRLPAELLTFRRQGRERTAADLDLVPGDRLRLFFDGAGLAAVLHEVEPRQAAFRLESRYASWRYFKTDAELARLAAGRYPGLELQGLEVLSQGVSGRVGKLRLLGPGSQTVDVEGLAVRWTLDLPDTRFTARRTRGRDGRPGWLFTGSGWGHGVGLCQIGSVNLAGRGASYREILEHYYRGVELARIPSGPAPAITPERQPLGR